MIVLDIGMPKVDGLTVLATLKADPHLKSIPVMVFVSPGNQNSRRARELKADLCVAKPVDSGLNPWPQGRKHWLPAAHWR